MEEDMNGISRKLMCGLIALLIASGAIAQARPPKTVNLIVFPGGFNWPVWVAQEKGLFAKTGIDVRVTPTVNSVFQLTNLIDGKVRHRHDRDRQPHRLSRRAGRGTRARARFAAVMGGDTGFLRLVTVPEVSSYAQCAARPCRRRAARPATLRAHRDARRARLERSDYS